MAENKNKLIKFFSKYNDIDGLNNEAPAPNNVNYLTDTDLGDELTDVVSFGIPYGSDAKSNIINSILRQVTLITYGVAELMATHGTETTVINSLTSDEEILTSLEDSIKNLATTVSNARILASTKDNNSEDTALTSDGVKLVTERTVFNAIRNNVTAGDSDTGYALDARQGKVLSDKIASDLATEATTRGTKIAESAKAVREDLKIKYLNDITEAYEPSAGVDEDNFLYIWKGSQLNYDTFSGNNSDIISRVFAIIE